MKHNKFKKELCGMLGGEIQLPKELSREGIENLINEKGSIQEPKRHRQFNGKAAFKYVSSAAAVIALVIGLAAAGNSITDKIELKNQDSIISSHLSSSAQSSNSQAASELNASDYSAIESAVLNYYKETYNSLKQENSVYNFFQRDETAENAADSSFATGSSSAYSTTNVQVEGVDEADIIKNDGRYIYFFKDKYLIITDCKDPENPQIASKLDISSDDGGLYADEMFLYGGKAVLILNKQQRIEDSENVVFGSMPFAADDDYALPAVFDTVICIYDVSDKTNPKKEYTCTLSGECVSSRITDGRLIAVTSYSIPYYSINADSFADGCEMIKKYAVPEYSVNGGSAVRIPSERLKLFDESEPTDYIVTALFDLNEDKPDEKLNAYLGVGSEIYCTDSELFIASSDIGYWEAENSTMHYPSDSNGDIFDRVTDIRKFDITNEGVLYNSEVTLGGLWLNQFSMDKHGEYFRIVTNGSLCENDYVSPPCTYVYVLDKNMKVVGYLDGIATGESMKASRFMGDVLYLVTFYQTDPLFVIDLSDPKKPEIKGELKIPGFSEYLHPLGNGLVLGIGTEGNAAKLSLFDVSDPCEPKEIDKYITESAYFNTEHRAFVMIDSDTFALPLVEYGATANNDYREKGSAAVFTADENGIKCNGMYEAFNSRFDYSYISFRTAFIENAIFAVNDFGLKAYDLETGKHLGTADFGIVYD